MLTNGTRFSSQAAGEILMLRFALKGDEESGVQDLLEQCLSDTNAHSHHCRVGIAYAAAELWPEEDFRTAIHPYLLRLLASDEESVAQAAAGIFSERGLKPDAASRELLEHIQGQPDLLRQIAGDALGECLISMLEVAPLIVANVTRSLLDAAGEDVFSDRSSCYFLAEHLLTVSLHLQETGAQYQELGAHIFERLLELNTPSARNLTLDLDKRTINATYTPPPRRRRRLR
jgi:hypothetical protein